MERPRRRRHHPPGVEEALSSMLWRPYDRTTPSESSDDDDDPQQPLPLLSSSSAAAVQQQAQTFLPYGWQLALTSPHHGIESKFNQNASPGYESYMYSDPIRYNMMEPMQTMRNSSSSSTASYRMFTKPLVATKTINTQPSSNGLSFSSVAGQPVRNINAAATTTNTTSSSCRLPSYEKIERDSRHWSNAIDEVAAANGIYFIPPSNLQRGSSGSAVNNNNSFSSGRSGMVNSFTDDFMQYQVSEIVSFYYRN